jgi:type II secretion system protein H
MPDGDWHVACLSLAVAKIFPWNPFPRARLAERGFTLIELLVVVVIITVTSAIALPTFRDVLRDRRTHHTAEEIARVYRDARLRAIGRGSAVLVHYVESTKTFVVREAVAGLSPAGTSTCARLPATSCLNAVWGQEATTALGSQTLETLRFDVIPNVHVNLGLGGTQFDDFAVCFTPLGRTFVTSTGVPTSGPTSMAVMTYAPQFRVWRTETDGTTRIGLERRVVLLPNGQARLQTAAGS